MEGRASKGGKEKKKGSESLHWFLLELLFQCLSKCSIFVFVQIQWNLTFTLLNLNSVGFGARLLSVFWVSLRVSFRNTSANMQPSLCPALWSIAGYCHLKRKGLQVTLGGSWPAASQTSFNTLGAKKEGFWSPVLTASMICDLLPEKIP